MTFPPPSSLLQLQILKGKEKFLRRFIQNYAKLTKGFTRLFRKGTSFIWDEMAQKSFDALKYALTHTSLLHPPNCHRDYFLYLVAFDANIEMVLVQGDKLNEEHVI